jgi:hypothetical protein
MVNEYGGKRVDYPPGHIEVDNRLAWFIGRLIKEYGDDALYVHLKRDTDATARSYLKRDKDNVSLLRAFSAGIHMAPGVPVNMCVAVDLVETINENIEFALASRRHVMTVTLENIVEDFGTFWDRIGGEGDKERAIKELNVVTNATDKGRRITSLPCAAFRKVRRAVVFFPTWVRGV